MSVCQVGAENAVTTLVECLLPKGGSANMEGILGSMLGNFDPKMPSKALHIVVSVSGRAYPPDDDLDSDEDVEYTDVHLLFHRQSTYTRVWSVLNTSRLSIPEPAEWTHRSCHDSCWRTDGLRDLSAVYLKVRGALRERNPGFRVNMHCSVARVQTHSIVMKDDPEDSHRRVVTSIADTKVLAR